MLKVVGASWEKTRLTTITLGIVSAIAIFAIFFFELPPVTYDRNYAATVFWADRKFNMEFWGQGNDPKFIKLGVARAYYKSDMWTTGWASLEIETNKNYPDEVQAHAAGLLEGSLCWQVIYWHWKNTVGNVCKEREDYCRRVREFIRSNTDKIRSIAASRDSDPYWHQVKLFYQQLEGLETGWLYGVARSRKDKEVEIDSADFMWMNSISDVKDLEMKFDDALNLKHSGKPLSIALLKLVNGSSDNFLLAHASAGYYVEMLRLQKRYNFGYHLTGSNKSELVPGRSIQFTSYPGALHSQDDFYHISGGTKMIVSGTAIKTYDSDIWDKTDWKQLMMGARVMVANRLSTNGKEWANHMSRSNSGTGNKQWMVVNSNTSNLDTWLVDQLPGKTAVNNITHLLHEKGYWTSFGLPYDEELRDMTGYKTAGNDIVSFFNKTERIMEEGQRHIRDVDSLVHFMRGPKLAVIGRSDIMGEVTKSTSHNKDEDESNEILEAEEGLLAVGGARTETGKTSGESKLLVADKPLAFYNSPSNAISKSEASQEHKYYPELPELRRHHHRVLRKELSGNTDLKISTGKPSTFQAVAGPPYTDLIDPFQWSKTVFNDISHQGQPDVWDFDPVEMDWAWD